MIITNERLGAWVRHRLGDKVSLDSLPQYVQKALDQNKDFVDYADTVGRQTVYCYVGFVDLAGFSEKTSGLPAREVCDYLSPFLEDVVNLLTDVSCLVDKTIGDEIMFILPAGEERSFPPALHHFANMMANLSRYGISVAEQFHFRIAISMGNLYFKSIGNDRYREVAAFGEPISVAKRLIGIQELKKPHLPLCCIGAKKSMRGNGGKGAQLEDLIQLCTNFHSAWRRTQPLMTAVLKGVGPVEYGVIEANQSARQT